MDKRVLGTTTAGLEVPALGFGAMALIAGLYGDNDDDRALACLRHVIDRGAGFIDTSDAYGADGDNERLVGRATAGRRDQAVVATKWGIVPPDHIDARRVPATYANEILVDARPERAAEAVEASLRRLGTDVIDLWYLHFPDPAVPIAETIGGMAAVAEAGMVRHLGVCNVTAEQLRAAHAVHPITAVQVEWSLWTRDAETDLVPTARELGIGIVTWGPLGTGFLAGSADRIGAQDFRRNAPRFSDRNLAANRDRFAPLRDFAAARGISPARLALAWLLAQGDDVVPIPGSRSIDHIDDNLGAAEVRLSGSDLAELDRIAPPGLAAGEHLMQTQTGEQTGALSAKGARAT